MSLAYLIACTSCGETMPFEDGYAYIYSHIQEERLCFIYQCGARLMLFEEVLALVAVCCANFKICSCIVREKTFEDLECLTRVLE